MVLLWSVEKDLKIIWKVGIWVPIRRSVQPKIAVARRGRADALIGVEIES